MTEDAPQMFFVGGDRPNRRRRSDSASTVMCQVRFRMTTTEKERTFKAARVNHQTFSSFVRDAIASATEECLEVEPIKREARRQP